MPEEFPLEYAMRLASYGAGYNHLHESAKLQIAVYPVSDSAASLGEFSLLGDKLMRGLRRKIICYARAEFFHPKPEQRQGFIREGRNRFDLRRRFRFAQFRDSRGGLVKCLGQAEKSETKIAQLARRGNTLLLHCFPSTPKPVYSLVFMRGRAARVQFNVDMMKREDLAGCRMAAESYSIRAPPKFP